MSDNQEQKYNSLNKERFTDIETRLQKARKPKHDVNSGAAKYKHASLAWRMVIELMSGILIGGCIGWGLDQIFGIFPWATLVFGLLGFVAGVKTMVKTAQMTSKV